jgi:hypothetical protein
VFISRDIRILWGGETGFRSPTGALILLHVNDRKNAQKESYNEAIQLSSAPDSRSSDTLGIACPRSRRLSPEPAANQGYLGGSARPRQLHYD